MNSSSWTARLARAMTLGASLVVSALGVGTTVGGCATQASSPGISAGPTPGANAGTSNPTAAPASVKAPTAKKGVIVPGDPASKTADLGSGSGVQGTATGTAGSRINPGQTNPGAN